MIDIGLVVLRDMTWITQIGNITHYTSRHVLYGYILTLSSLSEDNVQHPEDTVDSHVNPEHCQGALSARLPQGIMLEMI